MDDNPLNRRPQGSAPLPHGGPTANPYQPPTFDYEPIPTYSDVDAGSYGLGIALGLVFSLIGFLLVAILGKEQTKRGALHGFLIRIGITILVVLISVATR
ncbi:MAG: hypothetical protein H6712_18105 [Myxococcales bacterium]|nr:hypothetical protein [Myxococcales bacterium]MCB9715786.1 hypothetical protein [Myxococcales bacterium]